MLKYGVWLLFVGMSRVLIRTVVVFKSLSVGLRAFGFRTSCVVVTCLFVYILHIAIFPPQLSTLSS